MTKKIMAIALVVADLKKSISFYRDKLGLEVQNESESFADFKTDGTTIALLDKNTAKDLCGGLLSVSSDSRPMILAWDAVDDVDEYYSKLKNAGVKFLIEPKTMPWGQRVAYFADPDNNLWEISQFIKQ